MKITIDPTELQPGDIVVALNEHDLSGCHCDVVVTVERPDADGLCHQVAISGDCGLPADHSGRCDWEHP